MTVARRVMHASGNVRVEYGAHKNTVNRFRLVCRDYVLGSERAIWLGAGLRRTYALSGTELTAVSCLKDTREGEVAILSNHPSIVLLVCDDLCITAGSE